MGGGVGVWRLPGFLNKEMNKTNFLTQVENVYSVCDKNCFVTESVVKSDGQFCLDLFCFRFEISAAETLLLQTCETIQFKSI